MTATPPVVLVMPPVPPPGRVIWPEAPKAVRAAWTAAWVVVLRAVRTAVGIADSAVTDAELIPARALSWAVVIVTAPTTPAKVALRTDLMSLMWFAPSLSGSAGAG